MKSSLKITAAILLILLTVGCRQKESEADKIPKAQKEATEIKRVGMVIKLKPEYIEDYNR